MTMKCIEALKKNTWGTPFRLILIDNGSDSFSQQQYQTVSDVYIKLDENYGLEYAKNIGMQFVKSEYFVSMDNDILVYHYDDLDWLARIIKLMDENEKYGAIAPRPQTLVADSMHVFETDQELVPFHHVPGYARVMRTAWVKGVGAWSDKREGRGHEELWIAEKFNEHGILMGWATQTKCWHLFGKEDTDEWGYPKGSKPEDSGHHPVWPMPKNDKDAILEGVGVEI